MEPERGEPWLNRALRQFRVLAIGGVGGFALVGRLFGCDPRKGLVVDGAGLGERKSAQLVALFSRAHLSDPAITRTHTGCDQFVLDHPLDHLGRRVQFLRRKRGDFGDREILILIKAHHGTSARDIYADVPDAAF